MKRLVELEVAAEGDSTHTVGVEIEQVPDGLVEVSRPGQAIARATRSLGEMLGGIRPVAESFLNTFADMTDTPDEIGLEFGLSLSADANLVVATTATQANFKVTLTWRRPPALEREADTQTASQEQQ
jgi:hypothetical protein